MNDAMRDSLQKMYDAGKAGKLGAMANGGCVYDSHDGRNCAIGAALSIENLLEVKRRGYNDGMNYGGLCREIEGLQTQVGLTPEQGNCLQALHDNAFDSISTPIAGLDPEDFVSLLNLMLRGVVTHVKHPATMMISEFK